MVGVEGLGQVLGTFGFGADEAGEGLFFFFARLTATHDLILDLILEWIFI